MNTTTSFSLVIPTYNERKNITILIPKLLEILRPLKIPFEIIVVDDNSPDGTWQAVQEFEQQGEVKLIRRFNEKDLSSAVITGFEAAKGSVLGVMDADLQHDETLLPKLIEATKNAKIVIASRYMEGGSLGNWCFYRRWLSQLGRWLANVVLRVSLTDPLSGFFVLRREVFDEIGAKLNPKGFKILLEIIYQSKTKEIEEIPFTFRTRIHGESKLAASVGVNYLLSLFNLVFGTAFPIQFLQFCLVGMAGVFVNNFALMGFINLADMNKDLALIFSIFIAMGFNYLLNNYWTFKKQKTETLALLTRGLVLFVMICTIGAFINYSCAIVLNEKLGMNLYLANTIGIGLAAMWNFRLSAQIVWKM
jgi:dolichol-phosphate mannosyltransferase